MYLDYKDYYIIMQCYEDEKILYTKLVWEKIKYAIRSITYHHSILARSKYFLIAFNFIVEFIHTWIKYNFFFYKFQYSYLHISNFY